MNTDAPVPGPVGTGHVLDEEQFKSLRELAENTGDPAFLRDLIDQFLDGASSRLTEIQEAARRGDAAALGGAAHGLRGTSATMGATALASVCAALEAAAGRGEVAGPEALDRVSSELQQAAAALRTGESASGAGSEDGNPAGGAPPDAGVVEAESVLDAAQLESLRELAASTGDPGFLGGLVDQYLNDVASQLADLRQAAASGDATAMKAVAHTLKGTSATMGATEVASACAALEQAAAQGDVAGPEGLQSVIVAVQRATAELQDLVP